MRTSHLYLFLQWCAFLVAYAHADCQLSAEQIGQTNRIFAFRASSHSYPLRLDVVRVHQQLDMICSPQDVVHISCQPNGRFMPPLPLTDCSKPLKATVEPVTDNSCDYTMYRVGYKLSTDNFLELYRSCYDTQNATAHFTVHLAYPNKLSVNRSAQAFTTDGIISGSTAASFQARQIYARFRALLGPQQSYVTSARDQVFDRGHLAPAADYVFEQNMRQTFKYINVLPQFRTINRSNWKTVETWVRKQLALGHYDALQICTGGLDVLQLQDTNGHLKSIYLGTSRKIAVPKWLFKIASDGAGTRYVFLTHNNAHVSQVPTPPHCRQVQCPETLQLRNSKEAGFTFCCEPNEFINKNMPKLAQVC